MYVTIKMTSTVENKRKSYNTRARYYGLNLRICRRF